MKQGTIEEVRREVAAVCEALSITPMVLTYSEYSEQKQLLLSRPHSLRFSSDLTWLYDPDSWRQDLLPPADWDSDFKYVVLLEGNDRHELSRKAEELVMLGQKIGLVIMFPKP